MQKAYENHYGMCTWADATHYQEVAHDWAKEVQSDMADFAKVLARPGMSSGKETVCYMVADTQHVAAAKYARARFALGLREDDYNVA